MEMNAFIHFSINTFTDKEWGYGDESEKVFVPTAFDADQIVRVAKEAGMKGLILTAKHHDGFCLWPTQYTEHSVKNSPWRDGKGDVVKEISQACRRQGLKFGVYLSPWDRHERTYGSDAYNTYYRNQLRELLTNYGRITEVWWDGACGEGPNGKRQVYDWDGYVKVVRELQPDALIFGMGPDIRWVGNEDGLARESEWSVLPKAGVGDQTAADLGNRKYLAAAKGLVWYPAECDVSIRPGWFWHAKEDSRIRSVNNLVDLYFKSVGRNSLLLLNVPPTRDGLLAEGDVKRLADFRARLDEIFRTDLAAGRPAKASNTRGGDEAFGPDKALDGQVDSYWATDDGVTSGWIEVDLGAPTRFSVACMQEFISLGQRVEEYHLEYWDGAVWKNIVKGTTIGHKKLDRFNPVTAQRVRLVIDKALACPTIQTFGLYFATFPRGG